MVMTCLDDFVGLGIYIYSLGYHIDMEKRQVSPPPGGTLVGDGRKNLTEDMERIAEILGERIGNY